MFKYHLNLMLLINIRASQVLRGAMFTGFRLKNDIMCLFTINANFVMFAFSERLINGQLNCIQNLRDLISLELLYSMHTRRYKGNLMTAQTLFLTRSPT